MTNFLANPISTLLFSAARRLTEISVLTLERDILHWDKPILLTQSSSGQQGAATLSGSNALAVSVALATARFLPLWLYKRQHLLKT